MRNLLTYALLSILLIGNTAFATINPYRLNAPVYEFSISPRHNLQVVYDFLHDQHQLVCTGKGNSQEGVFINWINPKKTTSSSKSFPVTIKNSDSLAGEWAEDYGILSISNYNNEKTLIVSCEYSATPL